MKQRIIGSNRNDEKYYEFKRAGKIIKTNLSYHCHVLTIYQMIGLIDTVTGDRPHKVVVEN